MNKAIYLNILKALPIILCLACSDTSTPKDASTAQLDSRPADTGLPDRPHAEAGKPDAPGSDSAPKPDQASPDRAKVPDLPSPDHAPAPDQKPTTDAADPCNAAKQAVFSEMNKLNHCNTFTDCASFYGSCPFGCHIMHHKNANLAPLKALIAAYKGMKQCPQCVYKCAPPGKMTCVKKKCVMN